MDANKTGDEEITERYGQIGTDMSSRRACVSPQVYGYFREDSGITHPRELPQPSMGWGYQGSGL